MPYHCHVILSEAKNLKTCSVEAKASTGNRLVARLLRYFFLNAFFPNPKYIPHPTTTTPIKKAQHPPNATSPITNKIPPKTKTVLPSSFVSLSLLLSQLKPLNRMFRPMPDTASAGANCCNVFFITSKYIFETSLFLQLYHSCAGIVMATTMPIAVIALNRCNKFYRKEKRTWLTHSTPKASSI